MKITLSELKQIIQEEVLRETVDLDTWTVDAALSGIKKKDEGHLRIWIEEAYDFQEGDEPDGSEDEKLINYKLTRNPDGTHQLEMTVKVDDDAIKRDYLKFNINDIVNDWNGTFDKDYILAWNTKKVPSKIDKRKSRKIALSFSDTEVGTNEYGFIPRIDGEDPDDEDGRYEKHLEQQGIDGRVVNGRIILGQ